MPLTADRPRRWLRRSVDFLASGRLAVVLLAVLVWLLTLYLLIPQQGQVEEGVLLRWIELNGVVGRLCHAAGLTDVLHAWLFWAGYTLLFVNLAVCMARRLRVVQQLSRVPDRPPRPGPGWLHREIEGGGPSPERVAEQLRRGGYRVLRAGETAYALRGRLASIGHWVFHAGLLALLVAGAFVALAPDPFRGTVGVGEGEPFDLHGATFVFANAEVPSELPSLRFQVEELDVVTEEQQVRRFEARLVSPEGERATVGINRPYRHGPFQVLLHGFGYMPGWAIVNLRGRVLASAWVKLVPFPLEQQDSFTLGLGGADLGSVDVRFYPDHQREGEEDRTLGQALRNPRFRARVVWRGADAYEGLLEPGQRIPLQGGWNFFFLPEIRRYALLDVIEERGHVAVFACLAVVILGLVIRYARLRKEILVRMGPDSISVYGRGELLEHLFAEELDRMIGELAKTPADPAPRSVDA